MVSEHGIEANLKKVKTILDMNTLETRNEVQSLIGRLVALARSISCLTDKCALLNVMYHFNYFET